MDIKLKIGEHEVLATGSVIGDPQTPIQIELQNLSLNLRFETNNDNRDKQVIVTNQTSTSLELTFTNFDNPTGTGNRMPIHLGTLNGKDLYFNYRIYALDGEVGKLLHYTFYA